VTFPFVANIRSNVSPIDSLSFLLPRITVTQCTSKPHDGCNPPICQRAYDTDHIVSAHGRKNVSSTSKLARAKSTVRKPQRRLESITHFISEAIVSSYPSCHVGPLLSTPSRSCTSKSHANIEQSSSLLSEVLALQVRSHGRSNTRGIRRRCICAIAVPLDGIARPVDARL
jgi:hypothetical protein